MSTAASTVGQSYIVAKSDALSKIVESFYGPDNQVRAIDEANKSTIASPHLIQSDWVLKSAPMTGS